MKRCSTLLITREMKIKSTMRYHLILVRMSIISSVQSLSHVQLCDPMDCSTPGLPVHHQLLEFTQTHVRQVGDAIQPYHPLSYPSPPAFNLSQHQGLFKWVSFFASGGQRIGVSASASALPVNIQDRFPLRWTDWISKSLQIINTGEGVEKRECKLVQPTEENSMEVPQKLKQSYQMIQQSHSWAYIKGKTIIQKDTCSPVFTTAWLKIAKTWKQPKCPMAEKWIKKIW